MTDWRDISTQEYILFLSDWKTREEIAQEFNLSPTSSWHCVKFLSKINDVQCVTGVGFTRRGMKYKSRCYALEKAKYDLSLKKQSIGETTNGTFTSS